MTLQSLRARLILIILSPLLIISIAAAAWQFRNTTQRAEEIFDRGLLSAALAISRDVAVSGGDALSPDTRRLIGGTSGGELFYHVYAPDGVFVTGYATPPVPPASTADAPPQQQFYDATYQNRDVRVLRFQDATTVDGLTGVFTISVWQDMTVRTGFVREVVIRAFGVIALLVLSVALVVWFGVGLGLRPLLDLQDAISKRTPSELEPIRRPVPIEAQGIVSTLNSLLDRVSRRISSKDEFISNAAHQLRNPIAGVLALAEAVESAPSSVAAKERSAELVSAAREATHLTNQLLSFERAGGTNLADRGEVLDFAQAVEAAVTRFRNQTPGRDIAVSYHPDGRRHEVWGDELMLQEAILNLLTNSVIHGGPDVSNIDVTLQSSNGRTRLVLQDDGVGIAPDDQLLALGRFSQTGTGPGSGLGLPIAARVMENHGGALTIERSDHGAKIEVSLPSVRKRP
ncbi:Two component sensor kinase [Candidatus Rhodobacter oscarellae]|uniref:histidine kinase n=1 Tax=Candidatus Rhodobacter oscarellae TaxID=1675527 RepID=A0A0J9E9A1_9RHOB|nr:sensor histidine kinase [Candidatus Rhodobacter lobularis]KMW59372.1 Two component sensor kinase [Candidatus Rhodobacter lobularis]